MKNLFISALLATALFAVACTKDAPQDATPDTSGLVSFGLGFMSPDGTAVVPDNELKFSGVTVAVFTKAGSFHSAFVPRPAGDNYSFDLEEGNWRVWVLANGPTAAQISQALTVGESRESDFLKLTVDGSITEGKRLPMISASAIEFYRDPEKTTRLGVVEMNRLAARIDIVNGVDGLTINRVVMSSRATTTTLGGNTPAGVYEERAFNDLDLVGNSKQPSVSTNETSIYTYDNPNTTGDNAPRMTVHYTYLGEEGSKELAFGTALSRNNLYSVQFVHRGAQIDHAAPGWGRGDAAVASFSGYVVPNGKLGASHFVKTNVQSISGTNVTFCNTTSQLGLSQAWNADWQTAVYTDASGVQYRMPSYHEMTLLVPGTETFGAINTNAAGESLDIDESLPDVFGVAASGGSGSSDYWIVPNGETTLPNYTVYAIRFKNTLQVAAYRYKFESANTFSIRIKSLTSDVKLPSKERVCSEEFWAQEDEYINLIFPVAGTNSTTNYWTGSGVDARDGVANPNYALHMTISNNNIAATHWLATSHSYMRMVRVD